jgi:hypothetical protein
MEMTICAKAADLAKRLILFSGLALSINCAAGTATPSFVNEGNGTVLDVQTGLEWEQTPTAYSLHFNTHSIPDLNWYSADSLARSLTLAGGGWRLPTIDELVGLGQELVVLTDCKPELAACIGTLGPFDGVGVSLDIFGDQFLNPEWYWSSTADSDPIAQPYNSKLFLYFPTMGVGSAFAASNINSVWAVRQAAVAVPEPDTCAMLFIGLGMLGIAARRRTSPDVPIRRASLSA